MLASSDLEVPDYGSLNPLKCVFSREAHNLSPVFSLILRNLINPTFAISFRQAKTKRCTNMEFNPHGATRPTND
jgi:hypothetical protein